MIASAPPPNRSLQMLDAGDFDLLRPHLITIELVREAVLGEAGAALRHVYFPHNVPLHAGVHTNRHQAMGPQP